MAARAVFSFVNVPDTDLFKRHAGHLPHAVLIVDNEDLKDCCGLALSSLLITAARSLLRRTHCNLSSRRLPPSTLPLAKIRDQAGLNILAAREIGQLLDIENERDPTVAEDRGPGDSGNGAVALLDTLDDDLLMSAQFVDDDAEVRALARIGDDDDPLVGSRRRRADIQQIAKLNERHADCRATAACRECRSDCEHRTPADAGIRRSLTSA